jgi:hypothetical protein
MKASSHRASARDHKYEVILDDLRSRIVKGTLAPGTQLSTWDELKARYKVARTTIRSALNSLRNDGFIESSSTRGMYVTQFPPHLNRYAIVFPGKPNGVVWLKFWEALGQEMSRLGDQHGVSAVSYHQIRAVPGNEPFNDLFQQCTRQCFAGVLIVAGAGATELIEALSPHVPATLISAGPEKTRYPTVGVDIETFRQRSIERLISLGRKKIAILNANPAENVSYEKLLLKERIRARAGWLLTANPDRPKSATNIMSLLFDRDFKSRPDALVISDDNLVVDALGGIISSGTRIPEDLEIVAHCNWGLENGVPVPVHHLGFDAKEVIRLSISNINKARRKQAFPIHQMVKAKFENELPSYESSVR